MSQLKYYDTVSGTWKIAIVGAAGPTGPTGPSGNVQVTSPITITGPSTSTTIGINQSLLSINKTQVTGTALVREDVARWAGAKPSFVEAFPRQIGLISYTYPSSATAYFVFFTPLIDLTVSQITMGNGSGAAASGTTFARMGLYTVDETDAATLVARTATDTTLFNTIRKIETKPFDTTGGYPATYNLVAGQRYAVGVLLIGTTMPSIVSAMTNSGQENLLALNPRQTGLVAAPSDLPTTVASSGWGATTFMPYVRVS